ncbi:MAG: GNAT family N-acetyltransferase [Candidatus Parvarchaeota archaeon]|nr:GNAT family N-acetyltransferase [Candidatus Jingweiarchaeum tengchongense]MCW1297832.1 GNAT family N-acetyltransferase [Candidatus Jingweiarchaeum tengchongense]MCW1299843.1 GNAT family N-acetyltransferase [Candidatus Jingweiarchaeum tengchongense]MCW1304187.1 GNAT family N-acetyltransferase [Candidatus Jingweiarchaeum tengchongense]MCW1305215.1 GNAT family N-acetyltransferase [Candidatus Jingweiarchaeum tengchongense]
MIIKAKDGRKVVLRKPKMSDVKGLLNFINSLVREDAPILCNRRMTFKEERKWLKGVIEDINKKRKIYLVAEIDGKIIGAVEIRKGRFREKHTGELGVSVIREYRNLGIGKEMIRAIIKLAKKDRDLKLLYLTVYANNKVAQHVYEKIGFKRVAVLKNRIFYKGKYINQIVMELPLKKMG